MFLKNYRKHIIFTGKNQFKNHKNLFSWHLTYLYDSAIGMFVLVIVQTCVLNKRITVFWYAKIKLRYLNQKFKTEFYNSKLSGNRGSYLECCDQAEKADDLIFFIEDDYLFEPLCLEEMIIS